MKKIIIFLALPIYISAQVDYYGQIQPIWDNNCTSCHSGGSPSGDLILDASESYNNLVNVQSFSYHPDMRVVPNQPNNSVLYHKLFATGQFGDMMPPGGQLPLSERLLVQTWINEGAEETGVGGTISGYISLDQEYPFGQIYIELHMPDGDHVELNWGEDPPFYDISYEFNSPGIVEDCGYYIEAYFDVNDNGQFDYGEPNALHHTCVPAGDILTNFDLPLSIGSGPNFIDYISPVWEEIWVAGTEETIEWESITDDGYDYPLNIDLHYGYEFYQNIVTNTQSGSNGGSYNWSIPSDIPSGYYEIWLWHGSYSMNKASSFNIVNTTENFIYIGNFENSDYYLSNYRETWKNANEMIESWVQPGHHLVTIGSHEENEFINDAREWNIGGEPIWIGFTDDEEEGNWRWVTDEDVTYTNWSDGEPNNSGAGENYAQIWQNGQWNDHNEDELSYFIYEVSPSLGKISGEVIVERAISGAIYVDLYFPGSVMNQDPPDMSLPAEHVDLSPGNTWYYEFNNLMDGSYTVQAFIDADGSPNAGTGECDEGWDLGSWTGDIFINNSSDEHADIFVGECGGEPDHPVISNFEVASGDAYVNSDVEVYINLETMSGIAEASFTIINGTGLTHDWDLTMHDSTWGQGTITSEHVTMEGLMVQFYAKSNSGDVTVSDWYDVPVHFDHYNFVYLPHKEYMMVSFPGNLDDNNAVSVIANTLGDPDPARWRSFGYNSSTGQYEENAGYFAAGRALWVITDETSNSLSGGSGKVNSFKSPHVITLGQGWNMVGSPYAFPLDIEEMVSSSGDVELVFYEYDGTGYHIVPVLTDGYGYWVWSNEDGAQLTFDVESTLGSQKLLSGGWEMNLTASVNGFYDAVNKLGAHPQALDERDILDAHEPPVIGEYIQMAFQNYNWQDAGLYSKDIRSEGSSHYVWDLTVRSNIAGQVNIIALDVSSIPLEFGAVLVDLENKVQHDIRSLETYSYVSIGDEEPHSFRVVVGLPDDVSKTMDELDILPTEFSVSQNTPNPFNPVTSIRIELIDDALVTMKVYNVLGEEVSTLLNNAPLESGYHQVIFNGKDMNNNNVPSGLYLYQTIIRNNDGSLLHMNTHKMIMVK